MPYHPIEKSLLRLMIVLLTLVAGSFFVQAAGAFGQGDIASALFYAVIGIVFFAMNGFWAYMLRNP